MSRRSGRCLCEHTQQSGGYTQGLFWLISPNSSKRPRVVLDNCVRYTQPLIRALDADITGLVGQLS